MIVELIDNKPYPLILRLTIWENQLNTTFTLYKVEDLILLEAYLAGYSSLIYNQNNQLKQIKIPQFTGIKIYPIYFAN